jgi:Ca2+-binding EF-hand superfamily protein
MNRSFAIAAGLVALLAVQGCSSLNPFGGSSRKPAAAPAAEAGGDGQAEPAKPRRARETMRLQRFDVNGDGKVVRAELEQTLEADFKKEDKNGDGALDVSEARPLNERIREEKVASPVFDWNADGKIVYVEFASQWRTLFDRADKNRDGTVDEEEMTGTAREFKPRPLPTPGFSGKDGRPPGSP